LIIRNFKSELKRNPVSLLVFLATVFVVLLSLISVVFPAFLLRTLGGFENNLGIDPFELGSLALPLLITNFFILIFCILYKKNILPQFIIKSIKFLFNFEVSSIVAFFVVTIIIGTYITVSVGDLFNGEFFPDYYVRGEERLENYDFTKIGGGGVTKHFKLFLTSSSMQLFGNYKIIPFIASISLLVLTYFVTFEISKKRFAGIVALLIVFQSNVFLFYDTSVVYSNYWIMFFLLSIYMIFKKWPLSPISYILSIASKGLTAVFFPMTLFFIYRANIEKQKRNRLMISYGIIFLLGVVVIFLLGQSLSATNVPFTDFDSHDFWGGFSALSSSLRIDSLFLIFLLPLTVGLFVASRKQILHADSIMFFILTMLLLSPFLVGFSEHHNVPYRFVPLIVFFAIGVGILLSKNVTAKV